MNEHAHDHTEEAIAARLAAVREKSYLGDAVLGAMDGTVTTFAIVSATAGAGLGAGTGAALGLANLLADGFSMAVGNYLRAKSDREIVERTTRMEEKHVDETPEGEREEVRQIFSKKGFSGEILEKIVATITEDRTRWIETMVREEWGLSLETQDPLKAGAATFFAFLAAGLVPLLPLLALMGSSGENPFLLSLAATAATFFAVGFIKGRIVSEAPLRSGLETLCLGTSAAAIAYAVGGWTKTWIGS